MLRWLAPSLASLCAVIVVACSSDPAAEDPGGADGGADGSNTNGEDGSTNGDGGSSPDGGADSSLQPEPQLVPHKSGTRLKARHEKLAENVLVFRDIYDSQLNSTCQENTTADGKVRCMPPSESGSYYYSDANCQTRLVGTTPGACLQKYAYASTDPTGCTGGVHYYAIGAPYVPAGSVYRLTVNGCVAASAAGTEFYQLGAMIPDATFAELAFEYVPITPAVSATVVTSSDGLKVWRGQMYDPLNKVSASITKAGDDKMRVLPYAPLTVNRFKGGQTCNIALASGSIRCGQDPSGLAAFQPSLQVGCDPLKTSLYTIGAKYAGQLYNPATQCTPVAKPAGTEVYDVGAAVDLNTFAEATPKKIGDTKIENATYAVGGYSLPSAGTFTDKTLNVGCYMTLATDGTRRCMPWGTAYEYFTDAQCTARIFGRYPQYGCNAKTSSYGVWPEPGCNGELKMHLHALGITTSPGLVFQKNQKTGACEQKTTNGLQFFSVGAEVPPSSLVEGKPVE